MFIITAVLSSVGIKVEETTLSYRTIQRARMIVRKEIAVGLKNDFKSHDKYVIHWDGKLLQDIVGSKSVDRLSVLLTAFGVEQLLGVPKMDSESAQNQTTAILRTLDEWGLSRYVKAMCFDTTAVNTGIHNGTCVEIEKALGRELIYLPCRHHIYELILKSAFEVYWPTSSGPNVPIFGRFKKKWDEIDKTNYKAGIEDSKVANVVLSKKNEISSFITQCLQAWFSSTSAIAAPNHDLEFLKQLIEYKEIDALISSATYEKMTSHLCVPKLKGRENYSEWAFAAENFLILEGMSDCIKSETVPEEIGAAGFTRRISLLRSLISIRLENSVSMTSYVTQIIETSQKLSGTGFKINDEWVASLLLAGLTEKYSPMIMAIEHCGIPLTADAIKTKLLDMEESGNGGDNSAVNSSGAFASYKKNRNVGNTSTKDNAQMSMSKPKVITCYKCKQTGHYRNQCTFSNKNSSNTNKMNVQSNAFSAVFLNGEFCKSDWYIDSGASVHLTANEEWLSNVSRILGLRKLSWQTKIKYLYYVLEMCRLRQRRTPVNTILQWKIFNKAGILVATACLLNGVYKLNMSEHCLTAAMTVSSEVWHRRLGHVNSQYLNKMQDAVEGLTIDSKIDISKSSCVACCEGKAGCLFPKRVAEDEALKCFQQYKAEVENQLNCKIKILRSDNGTEFCNSKFDDFLMSHGIVHHKTNPYTQEQNGLSERYNRTIVEKAKCLLFDAGLEKRFWAEAAHCSVLTEQDCDYILKL
ncbi:Retrovirus-related Pol polyprotein from transposon TNT 1-94 [Eumeta japonica]|uniref:Retrovirus-related Pol polyprotein from transposon TNT 1-94 n=1 Tax=Eumeta variegata TaxID=151549 RepID=A0A4C1WNH2_EUMVA|nr:Retrovirus-related Pol polyprotein from transposon TNT 1-94 [Eumeta japonica]